MSWQPVQLPHNMGLGAGLDSLSASVSDLADLRQKQARSAAEQARQKELDTRQHQMDAQNALTQALPHLKRGDVGAFQAMMAPYASDFNFQDNAAEAGGLKAAMGLDQPNQAPPTSNFYGGQQPQQPAPPQGPPAQGGSAMPDQIDQGRSMATSPAPIAPPPMDMAQGQPQMPMPPAAAPPPGPGIDQLMQQSHGQAPPTPDAVNPILAGYQKDREKQAQLSKKLMSFNMNGQSFNIDPDAERNQAQLEQQTGHERNLAQLDASFGEAGKQDPTIKKYYPQIRAVIAGSSDPMNAETVLNFIGRRAQEDAAAKGKTDAEARAEELWMKHNGITSSQLDARARIAAASAAARAGEKTPTQDQSRMALLGTEINSELDTLGALPPLSDQALTKLQNNEMRTEAADKSGESGIISSLLVSGARNAGAVPKSKYEGLNPQEQQAANAADNAVEKMARMLTGAGMPETEARRMALQNAPHAGDAPEVQAQKANRMRQMASNMMGLSGNAAGKVSGRKATAATASGGPVDFQGINSRLDEIERKSQR